MRQRLHIRFLHSTHRKENALQDRSINLTEEVALILAFVHASKQLAGMGREARAGLLSIHIAVVPRSHKVIARSEIALCEDVELDEAIAQHVRIWRASLCVTVCGGKDLLVRIETGREDVQPILLFEIDLSVTTVI